MNATNAAQALREKAARLNQKARLKAQAKKAAGPVLAPAPVPVATNVLRLDAATIGAHEHLVTRALSVEASTASSLAMLNALPRVSISHEAKIADRPARGSRDWGPDHVADRPEADVDEHAASRAGLRGHLANPADYGPEVSRLVLAALPSGARRPVVVYGRLSAIHRAFPDDATLKSWGWVGASRPKGSAWPVQMELFALTLEA